MTSCWWRLIHPAKDTSSSRKRETSAVICRSYCSPAGGCRTTGLAEYSDISKHVGRVKRVELLFELDAVCEQTLPFIASGLALRRDVVSLSSAHGERCAANARFQA